MPNMGDILLTNKVHPNSALNVFWEIFLHSLRYRKSLKRIIQPSLKPCFGECAEFQKDL